MSTNEAWFQSGNESFADWTELTSGDGLVYYYNTKTHETSWEKPLELKDIDEMEQDGEWVWMPHSRECFVPARVINREAGLIVCETGDLEQHTLKADTHLEPLVWSSLQRITPDLVLLDTMNDPLILHNLRSRFENDQIYTQIGTILISINPYNWLDLYSDRVIHSYQYKLLEFKDVSPHVYITADNAFKGLQFENGLSQGIIISGESGSGKTECTKQCLQYISTICGSLHGIEDKVLQSNPILESFGNAETVRN
eukprot:139092_1